ncbi:hypothetical protein AAFF_G00152500 [Aldrovandia affinis]|uniref:Uncharacterized protein n=1 Tax=Aldrovandia affinis TaxID=143900 RepID=A0AAD7W984_9TELE|nr:hypothetical protein AAFF_G00152500 [Aldrovandia affinis]
MVFADHQALSCLYGPAEEQPPQYAARGRRRCCWQVTLRDLSAKWLPSHPPHSIPQTGSLLPSSAYSFPAAFPTAKSSQPPHPGADTEGWDTVTEHSNVAFKHAWPEDVSSRDGPMCGSLCTDIPRMTPSRFCFGFVRTFP